MRTYSKLVNVGVGARVVCEVKLSAQPWHKDHYVVAIADGAHSKVRQGVALLLTLCRRLNKPKIEIYQNYYRSHNSSNN